MDLIGSLQLLVTLQNGKIPKRDLPQFISTILLEVLFHIKYA